MAQVSGLKQEISQGAKSIGRLQTELGTCEDSLAASKSEFTTVTTTTTKTIQGLRASTTKQGAVLKNLEGQIQSCLDEKTSVVQTITQRFEGDIDGLRGELATAA